MIARKGAYLAVLRLCKFLLGVVGHSLFYMVVEAQRPTSNTKVSDSTHNHAVMLQQALQVSRSDPAAQHRLQELFRYILKNIHDG